MSKEKDINKEKMLEEAPSNREVWLSDIYVLAHDLRWWMEEKKIQEERQKNKIYTDEDFYIKVLNCLRPFLDPKKIIEYVSQMDMPVSFEGNLFPEEIDEENEEDKPLDGLNTQDVFKK